jgi:hypothetical protein
MGESMTRSIEFTVHGEVNTFIRIEENSDGTLLFELDTGASERIGDLRALFFDLNGFDADANGLHIASVENDNIVTDQSYGEGRIDTLGMDANLKGSVVKEFGKFDVGVEFGSSGMSRDDIQSVSFILSWEEGNLDLDMFDLSDFGIRYTSVGERGGARSDSAKIGGLSSAVAENDAITVFENEQTVANILTNDGSASTNIVVGAVADQGFAFQQDGSSYSSEILIGGLNYGSVVLTHNGDVSVYANGQDVGILADGETLELSFSYTTRASDGSQASAMTMVTLVGTADVEPILAEQYNTISVGTSGGTRIISVGTDGSLFETDFLPNNGGYAYGSALGDINGDGELDVLMSGDWSGAVIYLGDGNGGFSMTNRSFAGQFQSRVNIADIDNDGDGDLYLQNGRGPTEVWRTDLNGYTNTLQYDNLQPSSSYRSAFDSQFGDINGDGHVDLLIGNIGRQPISDALFLGDGAGSFSEVLGALPTATGYANAILADLDSDGLLDYLRGGVDGITVILNDGSGNFASSSPDLGPLFDGSIALADFNGDSHLDAVRSDVGIDGGIGLWLGNGTDEFVFSHVITGDPQGIGGSLQVGDFSGDGLADLMYTTYSGSAGTLKTMENDGNGIFHQVDALSLSGFTFDHDIGFV